MMKLCCFLLCMHFAWSVAAAKPDETPGLRRLSVSEQDVADYVEHYVLGTNYTTETVWMTDTAVPGVGYPGPGLPTVARDPAVGGSDTNLTYPLTWVVMLDEEPDANFAHDVRWIYVSDTLDPTEHVVEYKSFPPKVLANGGEGIEFNFTCKDVTPIGCPDFPLSEEDEAFIAAAEEAAAAAEDKDCLHAVLISGYDWKRYRRNIEAMYKKLMDCGYPEDQIYIYYELGGNRDFDGDGDNDITGISLQTVISAKIKDLCKNLDIDRDVLFIYTTGHGDKTGPLMLADGLDWIAPATLADNTKDCQVCRLFIVMDQCYSGAFVDPLSGEEDHARAVINTAATDSEPTWCRHYMDHWCDENIATTTIDDIEEAVFLDMTTMPLRHCSGGVNFCERCTKDSECPGVDTNGNPHFCKTRPNTIPQAAEGTDGNGDTTICTCWEFTSGPGPTEVPSPLPTIQPSSPYPTPSVSTIAPALMTRAPSPGGFGEPHFKTWRGHRFDYHGECDLVLLRSPSFASGKSIEIIIRTQIAHPHAYSYIASAVLKIGNDVLQVDGFGVYFFNGKQSAELPDNITGFPLTYTQTEKKRHIFDLNLHDHHHHHIMLREFKGFISVNVDQVGEYFQDCTGLLGNFETGEMLARDGSTTMTDDPVAYGQEWQVLDTEPMHFQKARFPQYPERCLMADPAQVARRRLQETGITDAQAEEACAHLAVEDRADCVFDVMETGDLEMAVEDALNGGSDRLEMVKKDDASVF